MVETTIPAGMKPWRGGRKAPDDWDGGAVLHRHGIIDHISPPSLWSHKVVTESDIIAYTPAADHSSDARGVVHDLDREHFARLHRLQHDGTPLAKPRLGGSLTGWAADEITALRAALSAHPQPQTVKPHVFLDCHGVLADFDVYAEAYFGMPPRQYEKQMGPPRFWQELEAKGDFYRNLPLMPDAMALFEGVKHLHPTILTGCPRGDWAQGQKVAWAAEHFPGVPIITCRSADKRDYAKPGDVLIDDWPQHRHRWIEMGGVFIVHHDAISSLAALRAHYPTLPAAPGAAS